MLRKITGSFLFFLLVLAFVTNSFCMETKCETKHSIKNLLSIALEPVGETLYIYGGGWNEEDEGAGLAAKSIGVSQKWKKFYDSQDKNYNYKDHDYEIENGLDCTGYMGWLIYNFLETEDDIDNVKEGYVFPSRKLASALAERNLGSVIPRDKIIEYHPGDIMISNTECHTYIVLGQCEDGSLLFIHSSPPGVSICGTVDVNNNKNSQAIDLAEKYMSEYYPEYQEKFPDRSKPIAYLTEYDLFRFKEDFISESDKYLNMSVEDVLEDLFAGR